MMRTKVTTGNSLKRNKTDLNKIIKVKHKHGDKPNEYIILNDNNSWRQSRQLLFIIIGNKNKIVNLINFI